MTAVRDSDTALRMDAAPDEVVWIGRKQIAEIKGALKPSAYVARAYTHQRTHNGTPPPWARKLETGPWQFDNAYVRADAAENLTAVGISEAAKIVGATRRTIQTWVDEGFVAVAESRRKGEPRRIQREPFMRNLPALKRRLETAAVVGQKQKRGLAVDPDVVARLERERHRREAKAKAADDRQAAKLDHQLKDAETTRKQLAKEKEAAKRTMQTLARKEREAASQERTIRRSLKRRLNTLRRESAEAISAQLRRARETVLKSRTAPVSSDREENAAAHARRAESARAVAAQLNTAKERKRREEVVRGQATEMAQRIADDIADGKLDRFDGAILFNEMADKHGVSDEIKIKITKQYFSK